MRLQQFQNNYLYEGLDRTSASSMMLWESAGFKLKEAALTADQIQQIFQNIEQGATDSGGNRTLLGKGKDAASAVNKAWEDLKTKVQTSGPISAVDQKYDDVVAKIEKGLGGPDGAVSKAVMKYRKFAKEHPIAQGLIYSALIAAAGISGAGLGGAAVLGLLKMTDKLLQGEKFSSAAYSGAKTGAMAYGASKLGDYLKGKDGADAGADAAAGAGQIKGARGVAQEAERIFREKVTAGEITDYNSYQNGMQDALEQAVKNAGGKISYQSQETAYKLLGAKLDSVAARAAGGEFSGSGPDKVKAVIDALGGQADASKIDAANQAVKTLSGTVKGGASNFQLPAGDAAENLKATAKAAAEFVAADPAEKAEIIKTTGMSAKELTAAASDIATTAAEKAPYGANMSSDYLQRVVDAAGKSGVRFKISPEDAAKALAWKAQNASESIFWSGKKLSEGQVYMIFGRVSQEVIMEGPFDSIKAKGKELLGKGLAAAKTAGHNLTTKVTADKLNSAWQKAGSPMDSDELAAFLKSQGVDDAVINKVYTDTKLPVPGDTPAAGTPAVDLEQIKAMIAKLPTDRKVRLLKYLTKAKPEPTNTPTPDEMGRIEPTMA